ncbi:MAG: NADH-quinone oxidoreductase subunit C [Phycisphaerae bacterium]|nr:NADH-quinone oxidoreductase subunit C [Phycisphaerae bacterium]
MASAADIASALNAKFPGRNYEAAPLMMRASGPGDQFYLRVVPSDLVEIMTWLHDDSACRFEQLIDLTCVDYLNFPGAVDRFGVNYSILSITHGHRLWIKVFLNEPALALPSVTPIWPGANWMEREVYDMFGIVFEGHPDLRRILTWDGFEANPLRKDYPLRGRGERENYEVVTRDSA